MPKRPQRLLLSFYGDDFTGSTDVLEALASAGVPTMLFMSPPSRRTLASFPKLSAFGVAGNSRTMSPSEMRRQLPAIFKQLRDSGAPLVHYKICSTFDSSPRTGSIGCAVDIAWDLFRPPFVPVVVGAPILGRYLAFGNLFARSGLDSEPYRLDRHPTMAHHPITPMSEADLRLHLGRQTAKRTCGFDVLKLESSAAAREFTKLIKAQSPHVVLFDTINEAHLRTAGELIWAHCKARRPLFSASSSGLEYALIAHWRAVGQLKPAPRPAPAAPVAQSVTVSGSCSPVTAQQIRWALANGWGEVPLDALALVNDPTVLANAVQQGLKLLKQGRSVIFHTARGPRDPRIAPNKRRGCRAAVLGRRLGTLLEEMLKQTNLRRVAVTGGDTSYYVAETLKIEALEFVAPMAPGSPLCRIHAPGQTARDVEIVFKGGQVGRTGFFGTVLNGR